MQVFQTEGEPPSNGSTVFAIIGCTENINAALRNIVVENSAVIFETVTER